jgi:23S rRNA pseudouridine1911/1915/1917 synthase
MTTHHTCHVEPEHQRVRLDKFLVLALAHLTRSRVQQLLASGQVTLAGKVVTDAARKVKPGEAYHLTEPDVVPMTLVPEAIPLSIIYEDAHLLVVDKPAGLTVHPAPGHYQGTLVHALLAHCGASLSGIGGVARPGIVHRIDKDTSGLLVVAKSDAAHQHLSAQLKARTLSRRYTAFVWGGLKTPSGRIDAPIARHPTKRKEMAVVKTGRAALTHYQTLARYGAKGITVASQLDCALETGRTHQIRVHFAHLGHALIGDPVYGQRATTRLQRLSAQNIQLPEEVKETLASFPRQALHARELTLIHPVTHENMTFSSPLPEDLSMLERNLATVR